MIVGEEEIAEHLLGILELDKGLLTHVAVVSDFGADADTFIVGTPRRDGKVFTFTRVWNIRSGIVIYEIEVVLAHEGRIGNK